MKPNHIRIERATARDVAERWRQRYENLDGSWRLTAIGDSGTIYRSLCALGPRPSISAVAKVIGNKSWSYLTCDACGEYTASAVNMAREFDVAIRICRPCLADAYSAIAPKKVTEPA